MAGARARSNILIAAVSGTLLFHAPVLGKEPGAPVLDTFICTLVPGPVSVTVEAHQAAQQASGRVLHIYTKIFNGFAIRANQAALSRATGRNPRIAGCTQARYVTLPRHESGTASVISGKPVKSGPKPTTGDLVDWGVQRIGGPDLNSDGSMKTYARKAYVVDTGVDLDHAELDVDVALSKSFLSDPAAGNTSPDDYNGHGSHVAGVIAARAGNGGMVGVAPGATVVSVRVLDATGSAPDSDVLAGLDYILGAGSGAVPGDVVNLSLTADPNSTILDTAIGALGDAGLKVVMAAGNSWKNVDTAKVSPAYNNGPNLFTVSAFKKGDFYWYPSNSGPSVEFAEPGENIYSLDKNGGYTTKTGTSMAAPHLSGILLVAGSATSTGTTLKPRGIYVDPDGVYDRIGIRP